jgi:hypothetical protein
MKSLIYILWPDSADNDSELYTVTYVVKSPEEKYFSYSLNPDCVGLYRVSSTTYLNKYHPNEVSFEIKSGSVSLSTTTGRVLSESRSELPNIEMMAGQKALLVITLRDKFTNPSFLADDNLANFAASIKGQSQTQNLIEIFPSESAIAFLITFLLQGENSIKAQYHGVDITCSRCIFNVSPGSAVFENSVLLVYNKKTLKFEAVGELFIFKTDIFKVSGTNRK